MTPPECWKIKAGLRPCGGADVLLDTPEITQRKDYDCGAACLEILFKFHGVPFPPAYRGLSSPEKGMTPDTLEAAVRAGFPPKDGKCVVVGRLDLRGLRALVAFTPVICHVVLAGSDHWLVCRGLSRGRVYVQDPLAGRGSYPEATFLSLWASSCGAWPRLAISGWPG